MKLYKLTDENGCTHGNMKWKKGTVLSLPKVKHPRLCTEDVIHAYKNLNLAYLLNPVHANFKNPILWEAKGEICVEDWGKVGCFELKIIKKLKTPAWANSSWYDRKVRIMFAILCAKSVLTIFREEYPKDNRPEKAIQAAKNCLKNQVYAAGAAARVADSAAYAAHGAAFSAAAYAARAADSADSAAYAAHAAAAYAAGAADSAAYAAFAADSAAYAAHALDAEGTSIDFCKLADSAVKSILKK